MHSLLDQIIAKYRDLDYLMKPGSQADVNNLESSFGMDLPKTYRDFLLAMGSSRGLEVYKQFSFFPELAEINTEAREALEEDDAAYRLPEDAFVFSSRQAYSFLYFYCGEGDDPAVHRLVSGDDSPVIVSSSFSNYLSEFLPGLLVDVYRPDKPL